MANLTEEVKEFFENLFNERKLDIDEMNSKDFCDLIEIKDFNDRLKKERGIADCHYVSELIKLYLYLTKCCYLDIRMCNEDTERAGFII